MAKEDNGISRRALIKGFGVGSATLGLAACGGGGGGGGSGAPAGSGGNVATDPRLNAAYLKRNEAAEIHMQEADAAAPQAVNADEATYADKRGSYSKGLPHNATTGLVDTTAFDELTGALASGNPADFDAISMGPATVQRGLANPQASLSFAMMGLDPSAGRMAAAPDYNSAETAAEMGEVYWQALTRDVPFTDYSTDMLISDAITDLNAFSQTVGPKQAGNVTVATLFRGPWQGELDGPYISQFLYKDIPYGVGTIQQKYLMDIAPGNYWEGFMTTWADWLSVQNGEAKAPSAKEATARYISNARGLTSYVHVDAVFQAFLNAALIMQSWGGAAVDTTPVYQAYLNAGGTVVDNQDGFVTFGVADVLGQVTTVARMALQSAWYQKWQQHRRLRPEVYGGRAEQQRQGNAMDIPAEFMNSDAVSRLLANNGNYLLPQAYPEGSPTHPSYPAGHAAFAGACGTVLKAFFNESFQVPSPVEPDATGATLNAWGGTPLNIKGEVNKLVSNISLGRDAAGVHFRSDGTEGNLLGEQVAIAYLRDISRGYNEDFDGFTLTKFDGTIVTIIDGDVN